MKPFTVGILIHSLITQYQTGILLAIRSGNNKLMKKAATSRQRHKIKPFHILLALYSVIAIAGIIYRSMN